jgi:hypothetical protein
MPLVLDGDTFVKCSLRREGDALAEIDCPGTTELTEVFACEQCDVRERAVANREPDQHFGWSGVGCPISQVLGDFQRNNDIRRVEAFAINRGRKQAAIRVD